MKKSTNILTQFKEFYNQKPDENIEAVLERFAIFGGKGFDIEYYLPIDELIEYEILEKYKYLHEDVTELTDGRPLLHAILTGIALGDRRTHSAFKRARVSEKEGLEAIEELVELGLVKLEKTKQKSTSWIDSDRADDKLIFTSPFLPMPIALSKPNFFRKASATDISFLPRAAPGLEESPLPPALLELSVPPELRLSPVFPLEVALPGTESLESISVGSDISIASLLIPSLPLFNLRTDI